MIDCAFRTEEGRFYYCVRAVIIRGENLLVMRDENAPYYYLCGGKVGMGETAEDAVLREVREELGIEAEIDRPLYFCQNFFTEKIKNERYHEIGLYFLVKIKEDELTEEEFTIKEGKHTLSFRWLPFGRLKDEFFYPEFIKSEIFNLPQTLKTIVEKNN